MKHLVPHLEIGECYIVLHKMRRTQLDAYQPSTYGMTATKTLRQDYIEIHHIEDRGLYYYVGFYPVDLNDLSRRPTTFGYMRVYKNKPKTGWHKINIRPLNITLPRNRY